MGVVLFFFVFTPTFFAQSVNQTDAQGRKQGDWVKYYPNSKHLEYRGSFLNGQPNGIFYYYAYDGTLTMIAKHNALTKRSEVYFYHDNKAVKAYGIYHNMKKDSVWTYFSNTGIVSGRETYKDGVLDGMSYSYYINNMKKGQPSRINEEIPYKNGKKEGVAKEFYIDGTLQMERTYKNGELNGWYKNYTPSGKLQDQSYYFHNQRHGVATVYLPDGKLHYSYFINGENVSLDDFKKWKEKRIAEKKPFNFPTK